MHTSNDLHQQFASFFKSETLQPYAYLVSKKLSEGHICLRLDELEAEIPALPAYYKITSRHRPENEPQVAVSPAGRQPFVLYNNCLYLHRYFHYESFIIDRIYEFVRTEKDLYTERVSLLKEHTRLIRSMFSDRPAAQKGPDWQLAAAVTAVLNNFTIITGGPGTGKTTTVTKILKVLYAVNPSLKVALAAPTGKAAARMAESLKPAGIPVQPSTLHRLLGYIPGSLYFKHHRQNPLSHDVVIVDEASMIDAALFAKLLEAVGLQTRLILLGDKDQLASVEAGSLFGDLCQAQEQPNAFSKETTALINSLITEQERHIHPPSVPVSLSHPLSGRIVGLQYSHRFAGDQGIGLFSKAIIGNQQETIRQFITSKGDGHVTIDTAGSGRTVEEFAAGYAAFIREADIRTALQKLNELRVLCAVREGEHGVYALNKRIERYLERRNLIRLTGDFYENRPVMLTANNYTLGLFNGDTGIARTDADGVLRVWFEDAEGRLKPVLPAYIELAETVFAMTVHKSQGSEFGSVFVVLPPAADGVLLTRELLYTAVTRAKQHVFIQATEQAILQASGRSVKRASGIARRFNINQPAD